MTIDGIVLTANARQTLLALQASDNELLKSNIRDLTKVAKEIAMEGQFNLGEEKRSLSAVALLFSICDTMETLFAEREGGEA